MCAMIHKVPRVYGTTHLVLDPDITTITNRQITNKRKHCGTESPFSSNHCSS